MMNTIKYIDNALNEALIDGAYSCKNMTNTAISLELSTEVFSPLFIQIVRIPMTLGCNPMVIQLS